MTSSPTSCAICGYGIRFRSLLRHPLLDPANGFIPILLKHLTHELLMGA